MVTRYQQLFNKTFIYLPQFFLTKLVQAILSNHDVWKAKVCVSTPTYSPFTEKQFDTYLLESENITGPFRYISHLEFG